MKLTKQQKRISKSVGAIVLAIFYLVNVQSVDKDVPKQMARQDELETRVEHATKS